MVIELDVGVDPGTRKAGAVEFAGTKRDYHCCWEWRIRREMEDSEGNGRDRRRREESVKW